jgi:hypothetical protein
MFGLPWIHDENISSLPGHSKNAARPESHIAKGLIQIDSTSATPSFYIPEGTDAIDITRCKTGTSINIDGGDGCAHTLGVFLMSQESL